MRHRGLILGVIGSLVVITAGCLVCLVASLIRPAAPSPTSTRVLARTPTNSPTSPPSATPPPLATTTQPASTPTQPPPAIASATATRPPPTVPPVLPTRAPTIAPTQPPIAAPTQPPTATPTYPPAVSSYVCANGERCIKGNISDGEKIYHYPGCASYDQTKINEGAGERWFVSATEAEAAGWRRAQNCP